MRRGRILAIKWGMNPNSSSLGIDVTFLLVGATVLAAVTPVIGALLHWRRPVAAEAAAAAGVAAVGQLQVGLERRRQRRVADRDLGARPDRRLARSDRHRAARERPVDQHQRARHRQLDDRAEPLDADPFRRVQLRRA
ncbi:MAG TPA: hypothetical protein VF516_18775 [Kofleriaceae bacterium]